MPKLKDFIEITKIITRLFRRQ